MKKLIYKSFLIFVLSFLSFKLFADGCLPCPTQKEDECDLCYEKSLNKAYDQGLSILLHV